MNAPVVVVTGASKGIGLAVTRILLRKFNANVIALSRSRTPELTELSSESLLIVECDVSNEKALSNAIAVGVAHYRGLDALILNAGVIDPLCRIGDDTSLESWKQNFDVNFFSLVTALRASLPYLRKSKLTGRVVFVSSGAAVRGNPGQAPYNAAKAAMNSLCRTLGEEEPDIVSIAVRPGMVDTDMQTSLRTNGQAYLSEQGYRYFTQVHADGLLVKPDDCGHVIAALSVQGPKSLTGQFVSWDSKECEPYRNT